VRTRMPRGVHGSTFVAGSWVLLLENEANCSGLLREFVIVWWNSGESSASSCLDVCSSGREGSWGSDAPK